MLLNVLYGNVVKVVHILLYFQLQNYEIKHTKINFYSKRVYQVLMEKPQ